MSKFKEIIFPIFGLSFMPYNIRYKGPKKIIQLYADSAELIIDDTSISGNYYNRLKKLKTRLYFEITAINLIQLIHSPMKWGIDSAGKVFNLNKKEKFKLKYAKIYEHKNNLLKVYGISYPFELPNNMKNISDVTNYFLVLIYIDYVWYIYDLNYFYDDKKEIKL